jgi:TonB family protein
MQSLPISIMAMILLAPAAALGESEGDEIQPPRMQPRSQSQSLDISHCYSRFARKTGQMGRVVVRVNVAPDGSASVVGFPPGIEPWQEQTARCVVRALSFTPATKGGVPVAAQVDMPLAFTIEGTADVAYLKVAASSEEMESALQACYPPDTLSIATPKFRVSVSSRGRAEDVTLVESSGDKSMDEAGACVLKSIAYEPTKLGKKSVGSSAIIPITVRPPKQATVRTPSH